MLKPLNNYVLLERMEEETKTAGGIIIPDNAKEKPSRGRVIATGDGDIKYDFFCHFLSFLISKFPIYRFLL